MTLKEELEILRGEPIQVFDSDPKDIPCIETSDAEKLCKNPVVSVNMITYNHEPYIRQAIEGVMMQKTDFEFELVIGEDCSQDKTREICFEYQKKYPDKIRVLWWHENVSKLGGNLNRVMAHCRGEFIALCEGDDYWIDPLKLQKQVDVMRKYPDVGFCFCGAKRYYQEEDRYDVWNENDVTYRHGRQRRKQFFIRFLLGMGPRFDYRQKSYTGFIMTASTMLRKKAYEEVLERYDIFRWRLALGDATLWLAISSKYDSFYISDQVSVYRIASSGVFHNPKSKSRVVIDGWIVRLYFFKIVLKKSWIIYPQYTFFVLFLQGLSNQHSRCLKAKYVKHLFSLPRELRRKMLPWYLFPMCLSVLCFLQNKYTYYWELRFAAHFINKTWNQELCELYDTWVRI